MFYLGKTEVSEGELLFREDFSDGWESRWEITGGEWTAKDGAVTGLYRGNAGGLIYTNEEFKGDIILDFYGKILSPCNNDLNFSFRTKGWDYGANDADVGYIAGLNGWWNNRTGIERYPSCELHAMNASFVAESDREYHIQTGIVGKVCFIAVDGALTVQMGDPDPITEYNRVGLGTYCSHITFRDFKIYRANSRQVPLRYTPKF